MAEVAHPDACRLQKQVAHFRFQFSENLLLCYYENDMVIKTHWKKNCSQSVSVPLFNSINSILEPC